MKNNLVFTHRLDLAIRLVDTTSGRNVSGRGVLVWIDDELVQLKEKNDGIFLFQNLEKRSFSLRIRCHGFEMIEQSVDLDSLPPALPLLQIHLIPAGSHYIGGMKLLTMEGRFPGIRELAAVRLGDNACLIQEFDPEQRLAKILNPHHLTLERVHYAVLDASKEIWEPFQILHMVNHEMLKLDRILEMPFENNFPISPVVFGKTESDGRYCLRLRDESEDARWLVRWVTEDGPRFRVVDFRQTEHPTLERRGK